MRPLPSVGSTRGAGVCALLCLAIALADVGAGLDKTQYVGVLTSVPFLAATFAAPRAVLALGGVALATGLGIGLLHEDGGAAAQSIRLVLVLAATGLAALAARSRLRREAQLVALRSAADAASRAILRPLPPQVAGVPVSVDYLSASEQARVGGDLYEVVDTPHGVRMVIGDVRGKGLEAVRLAALTLGSFREAAQREADLAGVAAAMHATVCRDAEAEDFVTALLVEVDGPQVRMLSAGHPPPLRVRAGTAAEVDLPAAPPLGLARPGCAVEVALQAGDRVLLYTDGAAEARRDGRFFALVPAAGAALREGPLDDALARLSEQLREHTGSGPTDDVALLAFELPARSPRPALVPDPR